jgi:hypothetical protein
MTIGLPPSARFEGESTGDAMRRHVAWICLAAEQLDHGSDPVVTHQDIETATKALMAISLEVDQLEFANTKNAKAVA